MADYVHAGIFVPVFNTTEDTERFTFSPLSNPATKLAYWDEDAYVSELSVSSGSPKQSATSGETQVPSAADRAAAAAETEGILAPGKESENKAKKRKAEAKEAASQKKACHTSLTFQEPVMLTTYRPYRPTCNSGATVMRSSMAHSIARLKRLWTARKA